MSAAAITTKLFVNTYDFFNYLEAIMIVKRIVFENCPDLLQGSITGVHHDSFCMNTAFQDSTVHRCFPYFLQKNLLV